MLTNPFALFVWEVEGIGMPENSPANRKELLHGELARNSGITLSPLGCAIVELGEATVELSEGP